MDTRNERLAHLANRAFEWLESERLDLPRAPDGSIPLVVALPTDSMSGLFDRLTSRYPSGASVVTTMGDDLVLFTCDHETDVTRDADETCPVHDDTQVAMFVAYLKERGTPVRCRRLSPQYQLTLAPDEDRLFA